MPGMPNSFSEENILNSEHFKSPQSNSVELAERMELDGMTMEEKIAYYAQREKQLMQKLSQNEENFGQKRAKFMEMYLQKEELLKKEKHANGRVQQELNSLQKNHDIVKAELESIRMVAAIQESSKMDEIERVKRQCQEEVASLNVLLKEAVRDAVNRTTEKYETDRAQLTEALSKAKSDLATVTQALKDEREGVLAAMAKNLKKGVVGVTQGVAGVTQGVTQGVAQGVAGMTSLAGAGSADEELEEDMRRAQFDTDVLRSLVVPLEEEAMNLKTYLSEANQRIRELEEEKIKRDNQEAGEAGDSELEQKLEDLNKTLETEKASRTDLEMYVAVIETQKRVLQDEGDKLKKELGQICKCLASERHAHSELKRTWRHANDQFLQAQRQQMTDMRRMQGVLTEEQSRQISELKRSEDKEAEDKNRANLLTVNNSTPFSKSSSVPGSLQNANMTPVSPISMPSSGITEGEDGSDDDDLDVLLDSHHDTLSPLTKRSPRPPASTASIPINASEEIDDDPLLDDSQDLKLLSQSCPERENRVSPTKVTLSAAMEQAITAPRVEEEEELGAMLAAARGLGESTEEDGDLATKRFVSDKEWQLLQQEMKAAHEKLGRPCDMCANYEAQLVSSQTTMLDAVASKDAAVKTMNDAVQRSEKEKTMRLEMEERVTMMSEEIHANTLAVKDMVTEEVESATSRKEEMHKAIESTREHLRRLIAEREPVSKELRRLQLENEDLVGKHSKAAQDMQNESIELPSNMDDMQLLLLKFREDIITAKVARKHMEENLRSELLFLKDQVHSEQQERSRVEETLNNDLTTLQVEKAKLESLDAQLESEKKGKSESEQKLQEAQAQIKSLQSKSKQVIHDLKSQVEEGSSTRTTLDNELQSLRLQVQSLQVDLDNSEAVQRDFVKLSQSLQVQLEKIRASETEVRWQHEDDVDVCTNCQLGFTSDASAKSKHHCRHCGKIFCTECSSKTVSSGPSGRFSRVCHVCHTILVSDAQPFFSQDNRNNLSTS